MSQHILLIQNDAAAAKTVIEALGSRGDAVFSVKWVGSCSAGLEELDGVAAILVDLYLADSSGIETFDRLYRAAPGIPILVLTNAPDEETAKLAVQRGAQDYLFKDRLDAYLLPKALGNMIERTAYAAALLEEKERALFTLNSIGDAVVSIDLSGRVTYLNAVAETLTGWSSQDARGRPLESVIHIIDATTRQPSPIPMKQAIHDDEAVALTPNCVLIRRDGTEAAIEDSAAPIRNLRGAVTGAVMVFHDVSASRALTLRMSYLAQHDSLTDLPNRVLLTDRLNEAITLSSRYHRKLAILFLDLDHFKHINDSLGHEVGDLLLQSVTRRIFTCVRSSDTVGRQGGDEFVVILWEVRHARDAGVTASKILEELRNPHQINGHKLHITGSIGVATYPDDGVDVETLMKKADAAMYQAKAAGRDRFQFFKPDISAQAIERQALEASLQHAIERNEFELHYQSKFNLVNGEVVGAEALIRWRHPQLGLISPGRFISIAEDCGLLIPIGRWVLGHACRQARAWQVAGMPPLVIAVNISATELRAPDFVSAVRDILKEACLEPRYLELELTEEALLEDSRSVPDMLRELKEIGVLLALGHFGTCGSSLTTLKRLPIDALKIDQSFVRDLAQNQAGTDIVTAMIGVGKNLHRQVLAEGVETKHQLDVLRQCGCPQGQGFYFSRPLPPKEFGRLLKRGVSAPASA